MKIVCESCGAKYSIADERVSGKMFKIRCKRCSEVIIVRGDQQPAADAAPVMTDAQDPSWHVVVEGEQAGPYTPQQLEEMLGRGAIDWDAYVWTEGFDNWVAMREVDALVSQLGGPKPHSAQASAEDSAGAFRARPGGDTLVGQPSMGADPFADDPGGDPFAVPASNTPAPDLFARGTAAHQPAAAGAYRGGDQAVMVAPAPSPRVSAERAMTGARNENSVLFSLKNLQALATGSGSGSPPAGTAADRGGYASGEGSGLIDIRALATATGVNEPGQAPPQRDDLLSMGSHGGAFGNLGSPMLAPASEDASSNRRMIVWGAVASVALLSLTAVVIVYMVRSPSEQVAPRLALEPAAVATAPSAAEPNPAPAAPATPTPPGDGQPALAATDQPDRPASSAADRERVAAEHARKRANEAALKEASAAKAPAADSKTLPAAVAAPAKSRPKASPASLDELLDGALSSPGAKGHAAEEAESTANLADTPTRDQVLSAMSAVKPAVIACSKGGGAVATVTVNVAGTTGRVTTAQVTGVTGPEGSCIAQAVRKATFPRFLQKVFKVTFPYKL
jgi:predicted Zn finger-like uncharacterized protein